MRKYFIILIITFVIMLFILNSFQLFAMGVLPRPPRRNPPVQINPPPTAPEPLSLTLIGMGVSGIAGFYLGRRRKK